MSIAAADALMGIFGFTRTVGGITHRNPTKETPMIEIPKSFESKEAKSAFVLLLTKKAAAHKEKAAAAIAKHGRETASNLETEQAIAKAKRVRVKEPI